MSLQKEGKKQLILLHVGCIYWLFSTTRYIKADHCVQPNGKDQRRWSLFPVGGGMEFMQFTSMHKQETHTNNLGKMTLYIYIVNGARSKNTNVARGSHGHGHGRTRFPWLARLKLDSHGWHIDEGKNEKSHR